MAIRIKLKKKEVPFLNKLAVKVPLEDEQYMYIPFWFKKVHGEDVFDLMTVAELPEAVKEKLKEMTSKQPKGSIIQMAKPSTKL